MDKVFDGIAGRLHISDPEMYVNNEARSRSGHMSHAMVEYAPGKIIAFNSNCSATRAAGHSAFGYVEYRFSEDYGKSWSDINILSCSMDVLLDGVHTVSVEKAVCCNNVITAFILFNSQQRESCCEPWAAPAFIQSYDNGRTWTPVQELSPWAGRVYDAVVNDGVIYVLMFCNPEHIGTTQLDVYRLYKSFDNGKTFKMCSVVDLPCIGYSYGALQFRSDGSLVAYANNIHNGYYMAMSVSYDCGETWQLQPLAKLREGIRNVQISRLGKGYVIHGRAYRDACYGKGHVIYTSLDGLHWDDGILLEPEKVSCYYSDNLLLRKEDGSETLLVQYSDSYDGYAKVNVMLMFMHFE